MNIGGNSHRNRKNIYYFNIEYHNKESIERLCISCQEEFKKRKLIHIVWPLTDEIFYSEYLYELLKILEMVPDSCRAAGTKVLDVGCGEGRLMWVLKQLGFNVTGVDSHIFEGLNTEGEPRGPLLEQYFSEQGVQVEVVDVEKEPLPFADNYFDLVTNTEVIEHLHNSPKPMIQEIGRVLKRGGLLMLATPNYASLDKRMLALLGRSNHHHLKEYYNFECVSPPNIDFVGHVREFTLSEVEQMLKWENFTIVHSETSDLPYKTSTWLSKRAVMRLNKSPLGLTLLLKLRALTYKFLYRSGFGRALLPNIFVVARKE